MHTCHYCKKSLKMKAAWVCADCVREHWDVPEILKLLDVPKHP